MKAPEILKILEKIGEYCQQSGLLQDFIRSIGWGLVTLMQFVCEQAEFLLDTAYSLFDFATTEDVRNFILSYRPVFWVAFAMALMVLGYNLIVDRESKPKVFQALMLMICFLTLLPQLLVFSINMTRESIKTVNPEKKSTTATIVLNNMADLRYLDKNNFSVKNGLISKNLDLKYIDVNETVYPDEKTVKNKGFFKNYLVVDANGKFTEKPFDYGGWNSMWVDTTYYRYYIDFLAIFISLSSTILVLFFTSYKVMKILFEIVVSQFLGTIFAVSDLMSGERLKKVIKSMASSLFVLFMVSVLLKMYYLFNAYITVAVPNGLARSLLLLFVSFAVIDGPNIIESTLGVDAGLKSGFRSMATMMMAAQSVSRVAQGVGGAFGKATAGLREKAGENLGETIGNAIGGGFNSDSNSSIMNQSDSGGSVFNSDSSSSDSGDYGGVHGFNSQGDSSSSSSLSSSSSSSGTNSQSSSSNSSNNQSQSTSGTSHESNLSNNTATESGSESAVGDIRDAGGNASASSSTSSSTSTGGESITSANDSISTAMGADGDISSRGAENASDGFAQSEYAQQSDGGFAQQELTSEQKPELGSSGTASPQPDSETGSIGSSQESTASSPTQSPDAGGTSQGEVNDGRQPVVSKQSNLNSSQGFNGRQPDMDSPLTTRQATELISGAVEAMKPQKKGFFHGIKKGYQSGKKAAQNNDKKKK